MCEQAIFMSIEKKLTPFKLSAFVLFGERSFHFKMENCERR